MTKPLHIGFVLFPNVTQLDLTGPLQILSRLPEAEVHLVASSLERVSTDAVLTLNPTVTFADCPPLDIICIPGGFGTDQAIRDEELVDFVKREGARARYVTSVCTGAFVLGAAGLLKGKKATTHWAYHAELARVGAIPTKGRVVRDGNIFTGGGVTAGIDFALTLAAEIAGEKFAQGIQLGVEYDPAPPFNAGSPEIAPLDVKKNLSTFYGRRIEEFRAVLDDALKE